MYIDTCKRCGHPEGLHHYETMQCPKGGEAPVGKRQEWLRSTFQADNEKFMEEMDMELKRLEKRVRELEEKLRK